MQTIFEIFNPVDGKTEGFRHTEKRARDLVANLERYGHIRDFLPASSDGFYVVDMKGCVKAGPFTNRTDASGKADFENMANDYNSFSDVEHRI